MRKSFGILFGFFCLAMLDSIFSFASPIDFTYQHLSVIWHFYFIGVLVFVRDKPWFNRLLISMLAGLVSDLFITSTFPFAMFLYPVFGIICGLPGRRMEGNEFAFAMYFLCTFCVDFFPYLYQRLTGATDVGLAAWLYYIELITVLVNGLCIILIMYIDMVMDRFFLLQKHQEQAHKARLQRMAKARSRSNLNHPSVERNAR